MHREAELYVESEELRSRQHAGGQQQQQPQWGQLSGEDLYHEKDALRHRFVCFAAYDELLVGMVN